MKEAAGVVLGLFLAGTAYAFDLGQVVLHGFASQGYLKTSEHNYIYAETEEGTFEFNEAAISLSSQLTPKLRVGIQLLARDLGRLGNNEITLDWAYADYLHRDWLGFRFGKMKRPYGLYNETRDIDAVRTFVFLPMNIYDPVSREIYLATQGLGLYGTFPGGVSYEIQYGRPDMDENCGVAKNAEWLLGIEIDSLRAKQTPSLAVRWEPLQGLTLGASYFDLSWEADTSIGLLSIETMSPYVASIEYERGPLVVASEYRYYVNVAVVNGSTMVDTAMESYYASASYRCNEWFELGGYYSVLFTDKHDRDGERYEVEGRPAALAWRHDWAVATRFDINEYMIFKLEGHYLDGLIQAEPTSPDPSANWFLFAAKLSVVF